MHAGATALLQTKLEAPPVRGHLLPRRRLLALVSATEGPRLVLLSAPAGFGKTTFLALWCHAAATERGAAVAWVALDESDNDPARFLDYLGASVARALAISGGECGEETAAARPAGEDDALTRLINTLALQGREVLLVLDDYHVISAPAVHAAVAFLLEHLPAQARLAIGTRADPPLPLARLRARGQLVELRAADLRFTEDEIEAFFAAAAPALTPDELQAIGAYVEGWPAGVRLVALARRSLARPWARGGVALTRQTGHGAHLDGTHHLFAYLAEDVFDQQPPHLKTFLVQTAVLDRMCGPLCDAVLGVAEGRASGGDSYSRLILERLDHANLFVAPLDGEQRWYRYHNLFRAFLRDRLARESPAAVTGLHRRASEWHQRHGLLPEAVEHALAACEWDCAADLIDAAANATLGRGEYATLHRWLEQIPEAVRRARPSLCLWGAWAALLAGEVERIEPLLQRALAAGQASRNGAMIGEVSHLKAHLARLRHDAAGATAAARAALAHLPAEARTERAGSVLALGAGELLAGELEAAGEGLAEAHARCQAHNYLGMLVALRYLGDLARERGQLRAAGDSYREAMHAVGERALWQRWEAAIGLGDLARERNELDRAEELLRSALSAAERARVAVYLPSGYIALARTLWARGNLDEADGALSRAAHAASRLRSATYRLRTEAHRARLAVAEGDLASAERWFTQRATRLEGAAGPPDVVEELTYVRLQLALARRDAASQPISAAQGALEGLREEAERRGRMELQIEILALAALAEATAGRHGEARGVLALALGLAAPHGYVRIFLDEGEPMRALLATYRARPACRAYGEAAAADPQFGAYLDGLLAAFTWGSQGDGPPPDGRRRALEEMLSAREHDVLRLVAEGASNQRIAEELVISIGTVKSHINHMLGKLGARSRTEAVALARRRGLLR
jgi:LuxR family transcriptional regulator, maltose regulon positive regulatory protein